MSRYSKEYQISKEVESELPQDELFKKIKKADLCIVDLDECISPIITSIELVKQILKIMYSKPKKPEDRKLLLTLTPKSLYLYLSVVLIRKNLFGLSSKDSDLISSYANHIKNIPAPYIGEGAKKVAKSSYSGSKETLEEIASFCKTGIISYAGLEPIVAEYVKNFNKDGKVISFYDCTPIRWTEKDGVKVFEDLDRKMLIGKGELAKRRLEEFNSKYPITIGHSKDELEIVKEVEKLGGLSIGFNPEKDMREYFDVLVYAKNWWPIRELIYKARKLKTRTFTKS